MKKIGLFITLLLITVLPINIYALGICEGQRECKLSPFKSVSNKSGSEGDISSSATLSGGDHGNLYGTVTKTLYTVDTIDSPIFCIDVGNLNPLSVNKATQIDLGSSLHRGLVAIYRLYLIDGADQSALVRANDAMRILVARTGDTMRYDAWWLGNERYCWGEEDRSMCLGNDRFVKALENAGAGLAGQSTNSNYPTISNPSDQLVKYYCAGAKAYGHSDGSSSTCNSALSGVDMDLLTIDNLDIALVEDTTSGKNGDVLTFKLGGTGYENLKKVFDAYPAVKSNSEIIVTGCDVDEASKNAGFKCELIDGNKNILNNNGIQKISITNSNKVLKVSSNVTAHLNYKATIPFSTTSLAILECDGDSACLRKGPDDAEYVDQRLLMVDKDREDKAEVSINTTVEASCKFTLKDGNPTYLINNNEVSEKEYLDAGCCDVNPEYLKDPASKEKFKNFCMEEDFVHFENECGTKSKVEKNKTINTVASGEVTLTTCENESYIDYTHSYIWQLPMERIMEKVKTLESSEAYKDNLVGLYSNSAIANNLDMCYMNSQIGSGAEAVNSISENNNYCMLYTSEEDDLYFPGTAVATSGRFFVFNELSVEECLNSPNPGPNCFRQPYVVGKIYATMHTNFEKWERDYNKAIEDEKEAYNTWSTSNSDADKQKYDTAKLQRETLEKYKMECEQRNDIQKYWNYNLAPSLDFKYRQKVYGGTERTEDVIDTVSMDISKEAVRYWPNVSTSPSVINGSIKGSKSIKKYTISYGDVNETKEFDETTDYSVGFTQTLYYKPQKVTYATLPGGEYIIANEEYQSSSVMLNNSLPIGYVYNVRLTTYEGVYTTSFTIDKVGHTGLSCTNGSSNIQKTLDKYKKDNDLSELDSECVYCNQESEYKRVCDQCPDPNNPPLEASYVYRSVSLGNITPNDRPNTNWSDPKGASAEARIESLSGDNIVSALNNKNVNVKATILGDADKKAQTVDVARGYIYDDSTKDYLEYDFTLTTKDLQMIKKNNRRDEFDYGTINFCTSSNINATTKDADTDYCIKCNEDGKECTSTFIDAFADSAITADTRNSKWKYYVNNEWKFGSMKTIDGFENGRYPDPMNQNAYIKIYSNWP